MAIYYNQACPLCGSYAEYCWVDHSNRKYFKCPKCNYYQVSKHAENILLEISQSHRNIYAEQASQAPENNMLVILMPTHEHRMQSDDALYVSFVDKSELPLSCE